MRTPATLLSIVLFHSSLALAGAQERTITKSDPVVVKRGGHDQRIEYTTTVANQDGQDQVLTNSYVQLQTGLNRWDEQSGQYVPANARIQIVNGHGLVQEAQHRAVFSENLRDPNGTIDLLTPGGDRLVTQPVGIALTEADTGKSVFLAEVKDSKGVLLDDHTFVYPDAFDQFKASIAIRSHLYGIESDIILEEKLDQALIEQFGINPKTARIEVWHQILSKPEAQIERSSIQRRNGGADEDHTVHFKQMSIIPGSAYSLGEPEARLAADGQMPVTKQWISVEGIDFLIEAIPFQEAEEDLKLLPAVPEAHVIERKQLEEAFAQQQNSRVGSVRVKPVSVASWKSRQLPKQSPIVLASLSSPPISLKGPGLVIDYTTYNTSQTNHTFQSDTTYWITGDVGLYGLTTVEGGTVVKFTNYTSSSPVISVWSNFVCNTSPYNPAIFTAEDDDTVGERIQSSTGVPETGTFYAWHSLYFRWWSTNTLAIHDIYSRYSHVGIGFIRPAFDKIWNVQIYNCVRGIEFRDDLSVRNVLLHKTRYAFNTVLAAGKNVYAEHLTVNSAHELFLTVDTNNCSLLITNSLVCNVTNDTAIGIVSNTVFNVTPSAFQSTGRGNHYLTDDTYRNVGTTAISPEVQTLLRQGTTYAPIHLTNDFTTDTSLFPVVQRDTDGPDLGYHYAPIDYLLGDRNVTNSTLTLTNGVSIGIYGVNGITLRNGSRFHSTGRPEALNTFVRYQSVQEDPSTLLGGTNYLMSMIAVNAPNSDPEFQVRFTRANLLSGTANTRYFFLGWLGTEITTNYSVRHSQFINTEWYHGIQASSAGAGVDFFNNLFLRSSVLFIQTNTGGFYEYPLSFRNNLLRGGTPAFYYGTAGTTWTVRENFFDGSTQWGTVGTFDANYNAYRNAPPGLGGANNKTIASADYVTGSLGEFYYPASGTNLFLLVNEGSRNADAAGLYHFTCQSNESKEGASIVDIGFHYPATAPSVSGLVGHWKFDEGSGATAADSSGYGHNGTLLNGPTWGTGQVGPYAASLDGTNDYISATETSALRLTNGMTISFWMKKNAEVSEWARLVGKGGLAGGRNFGVWEEFGSGKRILFQFEKAGSIYPSVYSTSNVEIGQWYHVACTYDGSTATIYINGFGAGQGSLSGPPLTSSDPVTIGYAGYHTYFSGALDEVRIYNRALSALEINSLYSLSAYDSDLDGVPDYLEDEDGDGTLDSGETNPASATDAGLKVFITEPKANSNIP